MAKSTINRNLIIGIATTPDLDRGVVVLSRKTFDEVKSKPNFHDLWFSSIWDVASAPVTEILKDLDLTLTNNYFIYKGTHFEHFGNRYVSRFPYTRIVEVAKR